MTEQTPTDQEIDSLVKAEMQAYFDGEYMDHGTVKERLNDFARAVLAKWGSPVVAGEPVAWFVTEHSDVVDLEWNRLKPTYPGAWRPLYTTPQPTQAQAGAVDDTALIRKLVEKLELFDDAGPLGEGWQSNELEQLIADALDRLEEIAP